LVVRASLEQVGQAERFHSRNAAERP